MPRESPAFLYARRQRRNRSRPYYTVRRRLNVDRNSIMLDPSALQYDVQMPIHDANNLHVELHEQAQRDMEARQLRNLVARFLVNFATMTRMDLPDILDAARQLEN